VKKVLAHLWWSFARHKSTKFQIMVEVLGQVVMAFSCAKNWSSFLLHFIPCDEKGSIKK
jgi:hypothetical protein